MSKHLIKYTAGLGGEFFNSLISHIKDNKPLLSNDSHPHLNRWSSSKNGQGHLDLAAFHRSYWPEVYKDNPNMLAYRDDFSHLFRGLMYGSIHNGQADEDQFKSYNSVTMHGWNKEILDYAEYRGFKKCLIIEEPDVDDYVFGYSKARLLKQIKVDSPNLPIELEKFKRVNNCSEQEAYRKKAAYEIVARHITQVYSDTLNNSKLANNKFDCLTVSYDELYRSDFKTFETICRFLDADITKEHYALVEKYAAKNEELLASTTMSNHGVRSLEEALREYTYIR